jgi:predicted porin
MKKTLLALALALPMASSAFAATSNVDVYGNLNLSLENSNVSGDSASVMSRGSYVGLRGREDLGAGTTAIWQLEQGINPQDGTTVRRDAFIGLNGKLGTGKVGVLSLPYKTSTMNLDPFADTLADQDTFVGGVDFLSSSFDLRASQAVSYVAPAMHGLTLSAGVSFADDISFYSTVASFDGYSLAADYTRGNIYATMAYQNMTDVDGATAGRQDSNAFKMGAGYKIGKTKLGLVREEVRGAVGDRETWAASVSYCLGAATLKAAYNTVDEAGMDAYGFAAGADYRLSKRTTAYALFARGSEDQGDTVKSFGLGLSHGF